MAHSFSWQQLLSCLPLILSIICTPSSLYKRQPSQGAQELVQKSGASGRPHVARGKRAQQNNG